jgi:hypothetical protein
MTRVSLPGSGGLGRPGPLLYFSAIACLLAQARWQQQSATGSRRLLLLLPQCHARKPPPHIDPTDENLGYVYSEALTNITTGARTSSSLVQNGLLGAYLPVASHPHHWLKPCPGRREMNPVEIQQNDYSRPCRFVKCFLRRIYPKRPEHAKRTSYACLSMHTVAVMF